jgi:hypothetical protein
MLYVSDYFDISLFPLPSETYINNITEEEAIARLNKQFVSVIRDEYIARRLSLRLSCQVSHDKNSEFTFTPGDDLIYIHIDLNSTDLEYYILYVSKTDKWRRTTGLWE